MNHSQALPTRAAQRPTKVRQACDACRTRKIRCDGAKPCANCLHVNHCDCTYLAVPKKTGPKGKRKKPPVQAGPVFFRTSFPDVVRASNREGASPSGSSDSASTPQPITQPIFHIPGQYQFIISSSSSLGNNSLSPFIPNPAITEVFMKAALDAFFTYKYPITPILDRQQLEAAIPVIASLPEVYALITACAAVMVLSPDAIVMSDDMVSESHEMPSADLLLSEALRARALSDYIENPTITTIQTAFFLFSVYFCLAKDTSAWHYLREAITILQSLRWHEEETYTRVLDPQSAILARRIFWVLFITERAYALQRHRPLTLQDSIRLPTVDDNPAEEREIAGLLDLVGLFKNFDTTFLHLWNSSEDASKTATREYLVLLQQALEQSLPYVSQRTPPQQADLLLSREWLKLIVWQLCISKTTLRDSGPDESLSLHFPVSIARNMVRTTALLPASALEANGVGILEKMFDVGCSLADVLSLEAHRPGYTTMQASPTDYLLEIMRVVQTAVGGSPRHVKVLKEKSDSLLKSSFPMQIEFLQEEDDEKYRDAGVEEVV